MSDENLNISQNLCSKCSEPVDVASTYCPNCGAAYSLAEELEQQVTPEALTYHLGDFLVESGAITEKQLTRALDYQAQYAGERHVLLGQALLEMGIIDRDTLDRAITKQLLALQEALKESNRQLESRVHLRTQDLESRLLQIRTAADITQFAASASTSNELLRRTLELIVERFGYYCAFVFLTDQTQQWSVLSELSGVSQKGQDLRGYRIEKGSNSIVGWVMEKHQAYIAGNVLGDDLYQSIDILPNTRSEAALPMLMGDRLLGVLDIQHTILNAFDAETVAVLQTIANHIASSLQNAQLLEDAQRGLREISSLYQASHRLAQASLQSDVLGIVNSTVRNSPYQSALFSVEGNSLHLFVEHKSNQADPAGDSKELAYPEKIDIRREVLENSIGAGTSYKIIDLLDIAILGAEFPADLHKVPARAGCESIALIPGWNGGKLDLLLVLGPHGDTRFTLELLEPYCSLVSMAILTLGKVNASQGLEKRLAALQTLNTVSSAVSAETNLDVLYQVIHKEVTSIIGQVNFAIATYDVRQSTISIPYTYDGQTTSSVEAFPMGEGLTSIVIRTKKPLMLVEDTERKTKELGAIVVGKPAKSWLGVPLMVGGDVLGAILLQDLEREGRFDLDDQRLLEILASQIAIAVRNARLLESTSRQAARQQQLYEIASKIRSSPDIQGILQTTAVELSKVLGARRAKIELGAPTPEREEPVS